MRSGEISEARAAEIADAANRLFQIESGLIRQEADIAAMKSEAGAVLESAGREAVREVCGYNLGSLDSRFWASDDESLRGRRSVISYLREGWFSVGPFTEFGLDEHHLLSIARSTEKRLQPLDEAARTRLLRDVSGKIQAELVVLDPHPHIAFSRLTRAEYQKPQ